MYDSKSLAELEKIVANLRAQIAVHPDWHLEQVQLKECERLIELRRRERQQDRRQGAIRSGEDRRKVNIPPPQGGPLRSGQDRRQADRRSEQR